MSSLAMLPFLLVCTLVFADPPIATPPATPTTPAVTQPARGNPATMDPKSIPIAPTDPAFKGNPPGGIKLQKAVRDPTLPPELLEVPRDYTAPLTVQTGLPVTDLVLRGSKGEATFKIEIASDFESRRIGLGGRTEFKSGTGMLFVHPITSTYGYWMKDVAFPIDMIYIDFGGKVAALHRMKPDPRREGEDPTMYQNRLKQYSSNRPVNFALEVPAGTIDALGITLGRMVINDVPAMLKLCEGKRQQ